MRSAGEYNRRFLWKQRSRASKDTAGQPIETFSDGTNLWGRIETDSTSDDSLQRQTVQVTRNVIAVRGKIAIANGDTLTDQKSQLTWSVRTNRYDIADQETICEVQR